VADETATALTTQGGEMLKKTNDTHDDQDLVTQEELRELVELEANARKAELLRDSIKQRFLNGAKVEPGSCSVFVTANYRTDTTYRGIRKLFGDVGNSVIDALPKRRVFRMTLNPERPTRHKDEPAVVFDPEDLKLREEIFSEINLPRTVLSSQEMSP
jgi:hypothetical protein